MSSSAIDGLVSGLSTGSIIEQLMSLERQPANRLAMRKATNEAMITAYQSVNTKLSALRIAADALTNVSAWNARSVTSSSPSILASATPDALTGSMTFDVTSVAAAQSYVYGTAVASTAVVVADGPITITKGAADPVVINVGDGSLANVVGAINSANAGVRASAVQTGDGVRLQLTSTTTGAASTFGVAGLTVGGVSALGASNVLVAGADAVLTVGPGSPAQYTITSPTNSLTPMPGLTLTVKAPATGVTVDVARNDSAVADAVAKFVDATNAVLAEITKSTAYDTAKKKGAILIGDSALRSLKQRILEQVSSVIGGTATSAAAAGIELQRDGTVKFNRDTFLTKLTADPDATAALFKAGAATTDSRVTFSSVTDRTQESAGSAYPVVITSAARRAEARLSVSGVVDGTTTLNLVVGAKNVAVGVQPGDTAAQLVDRINQASAAEGLGLAAQLDGADVVVRTSAYGSAPTFTMSAANGLTATATTAGADVAGTIDGLAASGAGQLLTVTGTGKANGLTVRITATEAEVTGAGGTLALGTLTYSPGVAQRLDSVGYWAIDSVSGTITNSIGGRRTENARIDNDLDKWDLRLQLREAALRRQFTGLETALGNLRSQSTWLAGQLNGLSSGE